MVKIMEKPIFYKWDDFGVKHPLFLETSKERFLVLRLGFPILKMVHFILVVTRNPHPGARGGSEKTYDEVITN